MPPMPMSDISERAQILLKTLIERHIRDGQPVGSKTLLEEAGLPVSAATVRNVMSDLEERGFLVSPHTSAGRIPTPAGYRLFVDTLLQARPIDEESIETMRGELNPDLPARDLVQNVSRLLSSITSQAGVVTVPRQEMVQLRQVEFLPLSGDRVLVILVFNEREVQNRIIHTGRAYTEDELRVATTLANQRFAGRDLAAVKEQVIAEMEADRASIDSYMESTLELASKAFQDEEEQGEEYVVAGESRLLDSASPEELERLRELFEAFQRKKDLLHLLERCSKARGIQIFIGEEAGYEVLGGYSVVTAPYTDGVQTLGVLGVIGPTRMAYERVIPIVDITARMLSSALSQLEPAIHVRSFGHLNYGDLAPYRLLAVKFNNNLEYFVGKGKPAKADPAMAEKTDRDAEASRENAAAEPAAEAQKATGEPAAEVREAPASGAGDTGKTGGDTGKTGGDTNGTESTPEQLQEELAQAKDAALRAAAEAQNTRRRAEQDVEKARKFALERFVGELLPVIDNLERATEAAADAGSDTVKSIAEGVELTRKSLLDVLGKFDIAVIDPVGEPFDPNLHQAMTLVPNPDMEPNTVMEVMQKGYTLSGRLIRPAMVVVSK